ncbi:MAG: hypothetical protein AB7K08_14880, partial [Microbacteriaceae bacterium]
MERTPPTPTPSDGEKQPGPADRPIEIPHELLDAAFTDGDADALGELLTHSLRDAIVEATALGEPLDPTAARLIAFALEAFAAAEHAPLLQRFFNDGTGTHTELREVYLPVHADPNVAAEFHVLLDALGTYLFHQERPQTAQLFAKAMEGSLVYFDTLPDGRRVGIGFASSEKFGPVAFENVGRNLTDLIAEHGDPLRAYLRLPGVDVLDTDLIDNFRARTLHPVSGAHDQPLTDAELVAGFEWDAVEVDGILHAFRIPPQP